MPGKKSGLTFEEHQAVGEALKRIRGELLTLGVKVANAYPKASAESSSILNVVNVIDKAKNKLDSAVFGEYPDQATPSIYYGPSDDG